MARRCPEAQSRRVPRATAISRTPTPSLPPAVADSAEGDSSRIVFLNAWFVRIGKSMTGNFHQLRRCGHRYYGDEAWMSAGSISNTATSWRRPQGRLGGTARPREIPAQHPSCAERPHRQRSQLGHASGLTSSTSTSPPHRAKQGRLPLQPRRLTDHPHPDGRGRQGHRPLRKYERPVSQVLEPTIGNYFNSARIAT